MSTSERCLVRPPAWSCLRQQRRILHLRHRGVLNFSANLLPVDEPRGRHHRFTGHLRGRLCRPACGRLLPRALGRHPRPQVRAALVHVRHGFCDDGRRTPADVSASRHSSSDASRHPPAHPGLRGCRRNLGRQFNDSRARSLRSARIFLQL
jgi:hypothetical protein